MVKRIKSIEFSSMEQRRARNASREQLRVDIELYLYSIFKAEQIGDAELRSSSKKDLEKTERLLLCRSFMRLDSIPTSE